MRGEDSAGRARLTWFSMKTLSTHPHTKTLLENSLLLAAKEWFGDEKEGWELQQDKVTCHTAKSTKAWLERHEIAVVEEWSTKGDDITRSRTFGPSSTKDLRARSSQQRKE